MSDFANRLFPVLSFWLAPLVAGGIYGAIEIFTTPPSGHEVDYGMNGLTVASIILFVLASFSTIGFLLAFLSQPRIAAVHTLRLSILSALSSIGSLFGFLIVGMIGRSIISISEFFVISFFFFGAIAISGAISFTILRGATMLGLIRIADVSKVEAT